MTYEELQAQQAEWAAKRFGAERSAKKALEPLAGVVEEFGELAEAIGKRDINAVRDAIGDCVIYLCDVCTRMGWQMPNPEGVDGFYQIPLGRLAHAVLKSAQGIRQNEDHDTAGRNAVAELLYRLNRTASEWFTGNAMACAESTWIDVVSKRDAGHDAIPEA